MRSPEFKGADKQSGFLKYIVDETLEGRAEGLKGYCIAMALFGRKEDFDPQVDPIVRVAAGRLRRALEHYYLTAGKNDPVRIDIPKGGYVPTFQIVQSESEGDLDDSWGPSIAVMPLANLSGDPEQDYFADGLTEELTVELARYQEFRVIASQSTMRFKGQEVDAAEVGKNLGVLFLLVGSVRKAPQSIKVGIQLLDASRNTQIWGQSYKRQLNPADLIDLQEEIAQTVVGLVADHNGFITRRLSRDSRKKAPAHIISYGAVLSFYHYESQLTPDSFENAMTSLEKAVEIDPEYPLAWAMLGHLHADNHALGFRDIEGPLQKALGFAQKAVALAPDNQFAQDALTLVHFHRGEKELFLKHLEETIDLNPNSPYIIGVAGWHLCLFGEWDSGLALLEKGMKLNPYHPSWFHLAPFMYHYHRDEFEDAYAQALKFNYPELFWDPVLRALALIQMDREPEAKTAICELLELVPDFASRGRVLISNYVKIEDLAAKVMAGLNSAGLGTDAHNPR